MNIKMSWKSMLLAQVTVALSLSAAFGMNPKDFAKESKKLSKLPTFFTDSNKGEELLLLRAQSMNDAYVRSESSSFNSSTNAAVNAMASEMVVEGMQSLFRSLSNDMEDTSQRFRNDLLNSLLPAVTPQLSYQPSDRDDASDNNPPA